MPAGNPLGYLPLEIQQQLLGAMIGPSFMAGGGAGFLAPMLSGVVPAAPPTSFAGTSVPVQGRTLADMDIRELNRLLLDPRLKGDQARKNKVSAMIQQKQLNKNR